MISDSYSTARMWALTKRYCVENRRNIVTVLAVTFGIMLLMALTITKLTTENEAHPQDTAFYRATLISVAFVWILGLMSQIIGSLTFSTMSTKPKRITALMLPAAQSEKFISQVLIYIVGGNLALVLLALLADIVASAFFGLAPCLPHLLTQFPLRDILGDNNAIYAIQLMVMVPLAALCLFLTSQSLYVLGSAWWPRKSFLKTFVALFAVQMLLPILIPFGLVFNFFPSIAHWLSELSISKDTAFALGWGATALGYCMVCLIYYLAWRRFKRLEVVKRFL